MSTIVLYYAVDVDTKRCMPDSPQKPCKEPTSKRPEEIDGTIDFIGECDRIKKRKDRAIFNFT